MIYALAFNLLLPLVLGVFSFKKIDEWKARGYSDRDFHWKKIIGFSMASSFVLGMVAYLGSDSVITSGTVAILGYLLVFSSVTDIALMKIISEPTILSGFMGAGIFLVATPSLIAENYWSLAMWAGIVLIFRFFSLMRWMGNGDVLILSAAFFLIAWWIPYNLLGLGLVIACIIGLLFSIVGKWFGMGVSKSISEETKWNPETRKMEAVSRLADAEKNTLNRKARRKKNGKKRTYVPFGPALLLGIAIVAIWHSYTGVITAEPWWEIQSAVVMSGE